MEALLYFVFWGVLIFMMMRLGYGAQVSGRGGQRGAEAARGGNSELRWEPPETDTDPVCGKTVTTDKARPSVYGGNVYYFCSRECREVFEAAPDLYVSGGDPNHPKLEHSHA